MSLRETLRRLREYFGSYAGRHEQAARAIHPDPFPTEIAPEYLEARVDRCPTCGSRNPWFTDCKDLAAAEDETGRTYPHSPGGCGDSWHEERITETQRGAGESGSPLEKFRERLLVLADEIDTRARMSSGEVNGRLVLSACDLRSIVNGWSHVFSQPSPESGSEEREIAQRLTPEQLVERARISPESGCSHEFDALDGLRLRCSKCGFQGGVPYTPPRRWRLWVVPGFGNGSGANGPDTLPPEDSVLRGTDWCRAAEVEVMPVAEHDAYVGAVEQSRRLFRNQVPQREESALDSLRPASKAHLALVAAVLRCLETGVWPETIVRFVHEELDEAGQPVSTEPVSESGSAPERYSCADNHPGVMFKDSRGEWVRYDDHEALQAQLQRAEEERDRWLVRCDEAAADATRAEARIEEAVKEFERQHDDADRRWQERREEWERHRARGELRAFSAAAHFLRSQPSSEVQPPAQDQPYEVLAIVNDGRPVPTVERFDNEADAVAAAEELSHTNPSTLWVMALRSSGQAYIFTRGELSRKPDRQLRERMAEEGESAPPRKPGPPLPPDKPKGSGRYGGPAYPVEPEKGLHVTSQPPASTEGDK